MNNTEYEEPIRVILVEDDRDSGHARTTMLGKRGLSVRRTHSAEEVISEVELAAHDIIVADIRLTGLNGVDLLRHVRNRSPDFPVILLTAYDSIESAIQAVRLGAQDYILKPLDTIDDLIIPVKKAVHAHRLLIRSRTLEKELKESAEEYRTLAVERKQAEAALRRSYGQLRELAARLQSVREEERTRISREIHDELGHALTGLKMDLFWIAKRMTDARETLPPETVAEKLRGMTGVIDRTIDTVRRIAAELRPGLLDHLGLRAAVEWQMRQFRERTGIACGLSAAADGVDLDEELATGMFRILEEILTNVARHAEASEVAVKLASNGDNFTLEVSDNGKGITEEQIAGYQALGLLGMRERARIMGGEFVIRGQPGRGTTVSVTVPVADHFGERRQ